MKDNIEYNGKDYYLLDEEGNRIAKVEKGLPLWNLITSIIKTPTNVLVDLFGKEEDEDIFHGR